MSSSIFTNSYSILIILDYLDKPQALSLQQVCRKFYSRYIPMLIKNVQLWRCQKAIALFPGDKLYSMSKKLNFWKQIDFQKANFQHETQIIWTKCIQVNKNEIYMISGLGLDEMPQKECFKYRIKEKMMESIPSIQNPRSAFGIVCIHQYIYVCGGSGAWPNYLRSCEKYDIINQQQEPFADLPNHLIATTAIQFENRFIYLVGGFNYQQQNKSLYGHVKSILRVDVKDAFPKWENISISNDTLITQRCQIGILPLSTSSNSHEMLLFGGLVHQFGEPILADTQDLSDEVYYAKVSNEGTQVKKLETKMQVPDRIYFNQSILLDQIDNIVGVPGREALHVFDLKNIKCLKSDADLKYKGLISTNSDDEEDNEELD